MSLPFRINEGDNSGIVIIRLSLAWDVASSWLRGISIGPTLVERWGICAWDHLVLLLPSQMVLLCFPSLSWRRIRSEERMASLSLVLYSRNYARFFGRFEGTQYFQERISYAYSRGVYIFFIYFLFLLSAPWFNFLLCLQMKLSVFWNYQRLLVFLMRQKREVISSVTWVTYRRDLQEAKPRSGSRSTRKLQFAIIV